MWLGRELGTMAANTAAFVDLVADSPLSRRAFLALSAGAVSGLAGCLGGSSGSHWALPRDQVTVDSKLVAGVAPASGSSGGVDGVTLTFESALDGPLSVRVVGPDATQLATTRVPSGSRRAVVRFPIRSAGRYRLLLSNAAGFQGRVSVDVQHAT